MSPKAKTAEQIIKEHIKLQDTSQKEAKKRIGADSRYAKVLERSRKVNASVEVELQKRNQAKRQRAAAKKVAAKKRK